MSCCVVMLTLNFDEVIVVIQHYRFPIYKISQKRVESLVVKLCYQNFTMYKAIM